MSSFWIQSKPEPLDGVTICKRNYYYFETTLTKPDMQKLGKKRRRLFMNSNSFDDCSVVLVTLKVVTFTLWVKTWWKTPCLHDPNIVHAVERSVHCSFTALWWIVTLIQSFSPGFLNIFMRPVCIFEIFSGSAIGGVGRSKPYKPLCACVILSNEQRHWRPFTTSLTDSITDSNSLWS